jgi:hypothetical protein
MKTIWKNGLAFGCALGAVVSALAEPMQAQAVIGDPAWVLHFDVDALRPTAVGKQILRELDKPEEQAKFALYKVLLSFDPRTSLHGVTLYGATAAPEDGVALIYADFDPTHLARMAGMAEDARSTTNGQQVIYSWVDAKRREKEGGEPRTYAAIYEKKVVIFGQKEKCVAQVLSTLAGTKPALNPSEWFPQTTVGGGTSVIQGAARKLDVQGSEPHAEVLKQAKAISLNVAEQEGRVVATLGLDADSAETGKDMAALARGLVALLALQKDKPEALELAQGLSVTEAGARVGIHLSLSADEIVKVMQAKAKEQQAAAK